MSLLYRLFDAGEIKRLLCELRYEWTMVDAAFKSTHYLEARSLCVLIHGNCVRTCFMIFTKLALIAESRNYQSHILACAVLFKDSFVRGYVRRSTFPQNPSRW